MPDDPLFDLEAVYDREVMPLVERIYAICEAHGLPFVAAFCYRNRGGGSSSICTNAVPRDGWLPDVLEAALWHMTPDSGSAPEPHRIDPERN